MAAAATDELVAELRALALEAGLDALGVAPATPFQSTRRDLEDRKAAGFAADMHFTYGNTRPGSVDRAGLP